MLKKLLPKASVSGVGLGLRRDMLDPSYDLSLAGLDFMEVAPENWIHVGGRFGRQFRQIAEQIPITLHGLSLNIGGFSPIDVELVKNIKQFMADFNCPLYSEHLSFCGDDGHLYDLMPIPFTEEAVTTIAARIRQVQDILGQRIAMENVSYYAAPHQQLSEIDFINAVIAEADCDLLLDVNNIYVNSINHGYDAEEFLQALPGERTRYIHIAGHYDEAYDLKVDTHGSDVIDPVWDLLALAYKEFGVLPTLLERDFNIPAMAELQQEVQKIADYQDLSVPSAAVIGE
ncbi:MAG: DUF692 domain-containing protein [Pseudomonadales bacterium]|nr:DUF692 domain-containing protein [Pseudomonadales bacterium]